MPTYEYRCSACNHQFEVFARMSDPDPETCEQCGAVGTLEKVLFPVAVHYKGSGFYSTDYSGKKAAPVSSDSAASSSGESASSSSESTSSSSASSADSPSTGSASSSSSDA
jgi:putative FmdB family regulatory protein